MCEVGQTKLYKNNALKRFLNLGTKIIWEFSLKDDMKCPWKNRFSEEFFF